MYPTDTRKYDFHEVISKDMNTISYKAKCMENNEILCLKQINLDSSDISISNLQNKIKIWSLIQGESILKYYGSFVESNYFYLLSEYQQYENLGEFIKNNYPHGIADEKLASSFVESIINVFSFLHSNNLIRKNTELEHFQIAHDGSLKLNEFEFCESSFSQDFKKSTGTKQTKNKQFTAPETNKGKFSVKSDIWSIGLLTIELLTGASPKSAYFNLSTLEVLTSNNSGAARDFIKSCLEIDPEARPSLDKLRHHKFIKMSKGKKYVMQKLKSISPLSNKKNEVNFSPAHIPHTKIKIRTKSDDILGFEFDASSLLSPEKKIRRVSGSEIQIGRFTISKAVKEEPKDQKTSNSSSDETYSLDSMESQINDLNDRTSALESSNDEMMKKIQNLLQTVRKMKKE